MCWSEPQMFVVTTLRIAPCSHLRFCLSETTGDKVESSSSLGKAMGFTWTSPGAMYTTPRFVAPAAETMCRSWMGRPPRLPELHAVQAHPEVCEVFLALKIPPAVEMQRLLAQHAACCAHTGERRRSCMPAQQLPSAILWVQGDVVGEYGSRKSGLTGCGIDGLTQARPLTVSWCLLGSREKFQLTAESCTNGTLPASSK